MRTVVHTNKEFMEEVIGQCQICHIAMADTDGTPYVLPMNFGYQEGVVYLHSAPEGRALSILERNPRLCITFCTSEGVAFRDAHVACSYGMKAMSVMGWGTVAFEEDPEKKREILNIVMKHYTNKEFTYNDPAIRNVKVWKVPLESMSCKEFGAPFYRNR